MPSFKHSPYCVRTELAVLQPDRMTGSVIASWVGSTERGPIEISAAALRLRGNAINVEENGTGLYTVRQPDADPVKYEINYRDEVVELETGDTVPLAEFLKSAVRTTADGKFIASFIQPLHMQHQACKEAGAAATVHLYDLQALADHQRAQGFSGDTGLYDIVAAGLEDEVPFLEALQNQNAGRPLQQVAHNLFRRLDNAGLPPQAWMEIKDNPSYGLEAVRAMFRQLMGPYINDYPIERVLMTVTPDTEGLIAIMDENAELLAVNEPFNADNIMRGYRTSEVRHYRAGGADVIVFSDPMGAYAYSWPTPPTPEAEPVRGM